MRQIKGIRGISKRDEEKGKGREEGKGEEVYKVAFWNVAGLGNKDREFWEGLKEWDIMVLMETWIDERGWGRVRKELPKGYGWECQGAKRRNRKGRAIGGMVKGARKAKRRLREELREWRKRGVDGEKYRKERLKYKKICEEKKREHWMREVEKRWKEGGEGEEGEIERAAETEVEV
ncbi:hypothetical protein EAI_05892 [Harpegnathos saltator]|uniref:Endonuclease/exonuclease/phosphatase domain-containing protein n=1 Tax=Harpegnathos saltator TaxID=610380 RepID=E2BWR0_HARSA|nr:hypothetical protein EAI_05892 [Harpegnathos saltator]